MNNNSSMKHALLVLKAQREAEDSAHLLRVVLDGLDGITARTKEKVKRKPKYTGWFACFQTDLHHPSGLKFVGLFNPDLSLEETEPSWDLAMPMINPETAPEFDGW